MHRSYILRMPPLFPVLPFDGNQARPCLLIQSVNHRWGMPEGRWYSDSDLPLPGARLLPCSFKSGLSCCPKWCVAPHVEWTAGWLTCCWAGPLNTSPDRSYPHTHIHTRITTQKPRCTDTDVHTHTQFGWLESKATQYPLCSSSLGPIFFPCLNPNPGQSCVFRKRRSWCLAGGKEQIEGLWNDSGSEWAMQTVASTPYSHHFLPLYHPFVSLLPLWLLFCPLNRELPKINAFQE